MSEQEPSLFGVEPTALVYPPGTLWTLMNRCRDCRQKRKSWAGGGSLSHYSYVICEKCSHTDRGRHTYVTPFEFAEVAA